MPATAVSVKDQQANVFSFDRANKALSSHVLSLTDFINQRQDRQISDLFYISVRDVNPLVLVPSNVFDSSYLQTYYPKTTQKMTISHQSFNHYEAIFAQPKEYQVMLDKFPEALIYPESYYFLLGLNYFIKKQISAVIVYTSDSFMYAAYLLNNRLVFYNQFELVDTQDMAYYVLWIYKQHKIDSQAVRLICLGDLNENQPSMDILKLYVHSIDINPIQESSPHSSSPVLNALLCAL